MTPPFVNDPLEKAASKKRHAQRAPERSDSKFFSMSDSMMPKCGDAQGSTFIDEWLNLFVDTEVNEADFGAPFMISVCKTHMLCHLQIFLRMFQNLLILFTVLQKFA